jgi:radical SAM superfamily enzyme YgiQ (UPF0313 family)
VNKGFNKPAEYAAVLERLAKRNIYAITSFIFGMDNDTPGTAERTLQQIRSWPPGLPVFGTLTPFPSTPLYKKLEVAGRLTRPKHWLDFRAFQMAHTPLKMSIEETQTEVNHAWVNSYSSAGIASAVNSISDQPVGQRISILIARLCFRGIYFPQMGKWAWTKVIVQNRQTIYDLAKEAVVTWRAGRRDRLLNGKMTRNAG